MFRYKNKGYTMEIRLPKDKDKGKAQRKDTDGPTSMVHWI